MITSFCRDFFVLAFVAFTVAPAEVVRHPLNAGIALEEFQLFESTNILRGLPYASHQINVRPTGWIFGSATLNERIDLVYGLGATIFSIPSLGKNYPSGYENELYPAVAMVQASGSYAWGDLKNPSLKATFGQTPYKYNPDALEMGEYLFRSTPYPGSVLNSPFDLVNSAQAVVLGGLLSKNLAGGKWKNDILLTSANTSYPLGDVSLGYVTSYKFSPIFELGAGVNLFRLVPFQSGLTTHKTGKNAYFTYQGEKYSANPDLYKNNDITSFFVDSGIVVLTPLDSALWHKSDSIAAYLDNRSPLPAGVSDVKNYTLKGEMLMARFSLDLKPVLGRKVDLKFYGEWAMLGVQNYPVFYDDPADRMPVMLGLNIPTGGVLDLLNVEVEYWKNPYLNSSFSQTYLGLGTPYFDQTSYNNAGLTSISEDVKDDDFKWSFSATKSVGKSLSITAKAARDHMQVMQLIIPSLGKSYGDVMSGEKSWYYVLRMQVAI